MKDYLLNMVPEKIDYIYAKLFDNNHIGSKFGLVRGETLCTMDFIDKLLIEIQKIDVSLIGLSLSQLRIKVSEIIKGSKNFLKHILDRIRNPYYPDYNPHYSFSRELLDLFIQNLKKKYGEEINNCIDLVQKYKDSNLDLQT